MSAFPPPHTPSTTNTSTPSYANVAASNACPPTSICFPNSDTPEHITCIENKLHIQDQQIYITYNTNEVDSTTSKGGAAAYMLCGKLNEIMQSLDQESNQVSNTSSHLIKSIQFTERSALLIECESSNTANQLRTYCMEKGLITHLYSTAKIQPCVYCLVLKFVPCDGSFNPNNQEQLHILETEHKLEEGSILSAAWIKRPELWAQNQKTANVKITCSSPYATDHLLLERVFIANARIVIIKDTREPIQCNKCQEYGHIHAKCNNEEQCATCARPHPANSCSNPNNPHCISCGTMSNHASSDRGSCPLFTKHSTLLDTHVLENSLPYFPILGLAWTFMPIAKNMLTPTIMHNNHPSLRPIPSTNPHLK